MNKWKLVKKGKIKRFRFGWAEILKKRKNEKKLMLTLRIFLCQYK